MTLLEISRCFLVDRPGGPVNPGCSSVRVWKRDQFMLYWCLLTGDFDDWSDTFPRACRSLLQLKIDETPNPDALAFAGTGSIFATSALLPCNLKKWLSIKNGNSIELTHLWERFNVVNQPIFWRFFKFPYTHAISKTASICADPGSAPQDPRCRWDLEIPRHPTGTTGVQKRCCTDWKEERYDIHWHSMISYCWSLLLHWISFARSGSEWEIHQQLVWRDSRKAPHFSLRLSTDITFKQVTVDTLWCAQNSS